MTITAGPRTASLYFTNGSSDKEYHARLESSGDGYVVNFAYGRRGSALTTGTKTTTAVDYAKATAIFDKLVKAKEAKGYTRGEDGTPYQNSASDRQPSGLLPQLLNVADQAAANEAINSDSWCLQEKYDGRLH